MEEHQLTLPELEGFRELELQFVIDLNLLSVDMLTARRNSINKGSAVGSSAIDEIMMIESSLHLRILKKNSQERQKEQMGAPALQEVSLNGLAEKPQASGSPNATTTTKQMKPMGRAGLLPPSNDYLDPEEIASIRNQHIFDHDELLSIWNRNRGSETESLDDRLDRMSKVVAAIKSITWRYAGNVKQICEKERHTNKQQGLHENKQHSQLLQELEDQKQVNS